MVDNCVPLPLTITKSQVHDMCDNVVIRNYSTTSLTSKAGDEHGKRSTECEFPGHLISVNNKGCQLLTHTVHLFTLFADVFCRKLQSTQIRLTDRLQHLQKALGCGNADKIKPNTHTAHYKAPCSSSITRCDRDSLVNGHVFYYSARMSLSLQHLHHRRRR